MLGSERIREEGRRAPDDVTLPIPHLLSRLFAAWAMALVLAPPVAATSDPPPEPRDTVTPDDLTERERAALEALGYLSATQKAPEKVGVLVYDEARAWNGVNLWVSAHRQAAFLMDMRGQILHEWAYAKSRPPASEAFRRVLVERYPGLMQLPVYWRRTHLYPNGNLLVQRDFQSLLMLDKDSNLLWEFVDATHHDVHVNPDGSIYVLVRKWRTIPYFDKKKLVADDEVVKLEPGGREVGRVEVFSSIARGLQSGLLAELKRVYQQRGKLGYDLIHTNGIDVLRGGASGKVPAFERGRLLLSARSISALLLLDFEKRAVVWWSKGDFVGQHDPRELENGNLLLFDNLGTPGHSAVVELDPRTGEEVWAYRGTEEAPFHSMCCGTARRLPNGNTLIVETEKGRAFEVTRDQEIVWEFVSSFELGGYGAMLQDLVRLPGDPRAGW